MRTAALMFVLLGCTAEHTSPAAVSTGGESETRPTPMCPELDSQALAALAGYAEGARGTPLDIELDGEAPSERVVVVRTEKVPEGDEGYEDEREHDDVLLALTCADGSWVQVAYAEFVVEFEQGTFECEPGVVEVDAHDLGSGQQLVRVMTSACQGQVDPRWMETRTTLLALRDGQLVPVFTCATSAETAMGPCRAGTTTARTLAFQSTSIAVAMDQGFDPGACDESDPEAGYEPIDTPHAEALYEWDGEAFVTTSELDICL